MSVTVDNRRTRLRALTAAGLTVLLLVPFGLVFARYWDSMTERREHTVTEQRGVQYLARLVPLLNALTEFQGSALQGGRAAPPGLQDAVNGVAEVDQRLGAALGTRERWSDLRARIDALPKVTGQPAAVLDAHIVAADLLLGIFDAVRDKSRLQRDPDNDVSHLQQAIADDLPVAVTQAARMADLSGLLVDAAAPQRPAWTAQLGATVGFVDESVDGLTESLEASVTDTTSGTLSGSLIGPLDAFRRAIETISRDANPAGRANKAALIVSRTQLRQSVGGMTSTVLKEMQGLLQRRLDDLDADRREAVLTAVAAGLIALLALATSVGPGLRRRRGGAPGGGAPGGGAPGGDGTAHPAGEQATGAAAVPAYGNSIPDPVPTYGTAVPPTRREQFGALR